MSDSEWDRIKPLVKTDRHFGPKSRAKFSRREVLNAIFYVLRNGCQWRDMPNDFPPWAAVYIQFARWKEKSLFIKIHNHLRATLREALGRNANASVGIADSQSIKQAKKKLCGFDPNKRIKGRKRRLLVDHFGLMVAGAVGAANCSDRDGLDALCGLNARRVKLPKKIYTDFGYSGDGMRELMRCYQIELEIVGRRNKKSFQLEPERWVVERTFAWLGRFRRLSKDYELITDTRA